MGGFRTCRPGADRCTNRGGTGEAVLGPEAPVDVTAAGGGRAALLWPRGVAVLRGAPQPLLRPHIAPTQVCAKGRMSLRPWHSLRQGWFPLDPAPKSRYDEMVRFHALHDSRRDSVRILTYRILSYLIVSYRILSYLILSLTRRLVSTSLGRQAGDAGARHGEPSTKGSSNYAHSDSIWKLSPGPKGLTTQHAGQRRGVRAAACPSHGSRLA